MIGVVAEITEHKEIDSGELTPAATPDDLISIPRAHILREN